MALRYVQ